jgi:hypothetical protein
MTNVINKNNNPKIIEMRHYNDIYDNIITDEKLNKICIKVIIIKPLNIDDI